MNPIRVMHAVNESIAVSWHLSGLPWHTPFLKVLTYACAAGLRPCVHPLYAPGGGPCLTQDRPTDHPWQHGIFVGLHGVNGLDFWVEHRAKPEMQGDVRCVGIVDLRADDWTASWTALNEWRGPDGDLILEEGHTVCVHRPETSGYYEVDFTWALTGALCGLINGLLHTRAGIPAFVDAYRTDEPRRLMTAFANRPRRKPAAD